MEHYPIRARSATIALVKVTSDNEWPGQTGLSNTLTLLSWIRQAEHW